MEKWFVVFVSEAENDLENLNQILRKRIVAKLDWLQNNFDEITPLALGNEWKGFFKFRIGDWRIVYKIDWDKNKIIIVLIDHRSKIYKRKLK